MFNFDAIDRYTEGYKTLSAGGATDEYEDLESSRGMRFYARAIRGDYENQRSARN